MTISIIWTRLASKKATLDLPKLLLLIIAQGTISSLAIVTGLQ